MVLSSERELSRITRPPEGIWTGRREPFPETMPEETETPRFREHLHEMRKALGGIGHDVRTDVTAAPHLAEEKTKDLMARAAGVRRKHMRQWAEPSSTDTK